MTDIIQRNRGARTYNVRSKRPHYFRITIVSFAIVGMIGFSYSFGGAVLNSGTSGVGVSAVEWIRGHGGASFVAFVENFWYSHHKPPVGGAPPKGAIKAPAIATTTTVASGPVHLTPPKTLSPFVTPALSGEGVWSPQGRTIGGVAGLYTTSLRPSTVYTSLVAGVAWMDPNLLSFTLFAGAQEPGKGPWQNMAPFSSSQESSLVAAFNAGFRMQDAQGGWYSEGRMAYPLVNGAASFVVYKNGTANVVQWGRDQTLTPDVVSVRQNLSLIVDNGQVNPSVNSTNFAQWGATVGNQVLVWRSGVGVTANGAILYAAGASLSVSDLANVLIRAGAVRAMEMDINSSWTNFFYFNPPNNGPALPSNGSDLVVNMLRPPARYFEATARDFIAAFARPTDANGKVIPQS